MPAAAPRMRIVYLATGMRILPILRSCGSSSGVEANAVSPTAHALITKQGV